MITLLTAQTVDISNAAWQDVRIAGTYVVVASGDLGTGTLTIDFSEDGGTTVSGFSIDTAQTELAIASLAGMVELDIAVGKVRANLASSTDANLTVRLLLIR